MQALLGKISKITVSQESTQSQFKNSTTHSQAGVKLEVGLKPTCILPQRTAVPDWLKDQTITVQRTVLDAREVGRVSDSIILTPDEAAPLLYPLEVKPSISYSELPKTLQLQLHWWKDDKPPEFSVSANGRLQTGEFTPSAQGYAATVDTSSFFDYPPHLPISFEATVDTLKAHCMVLPGQPHATKLLLSEGEVQRLDNAWYSLDVTARNHAGGITALCEKGRGVNHFELPRNIIQAPLLNAGHTDRYRSGWNWSDKMAEVAMPVAGIRRESASARLTLEGTIDEGQNLQTSVTCTLYDNVPLILWQRDYFFHKAKEDSKDKDDRIKEPIDEMQPMGLSFRSASRVERNGASGSRIICADGKRLHIIRSTRIHDFTEYEGWRIADGWALIEHPERREYLLYCFDRAAPPHLASWTGPHAITLEPFWPTVPVRPEQAVGYALALSAGELGGTSVTGAWVACRALLPEGGVQCSAIGRFRERPTDPTATFTLGSDTREVPLQSIMIPGVGDLWQANVQFPEGRMSDDLNVSFGGIANRQ